MHSQIPLLLTALTLLVPLAFSAPRTEAALATPPTQAPAASDDEIAKLPDVVRRYFAFMGVVGRPRVTSLRTRFTGRFHMGLKGDWQPCEGWTYISGEGGAFRYFEMKLKYLGWMPLWVHDVYREGKGSLSARLFGLFSVADDQGAPLDLGELVTFMNDAILGAPELLLGPHTAWRAVDANSFDVTFTNAGTRATAHVTLDSRGAPTDFETTDRFFIDSTDPHRPPVRTRWSTPVAGWTTVDGRSISLGGQAVWHFPEGPFPYGDLRLVPGSVAFDVPFKP